ncbi:response regulator transcription factor [Brevibacillus sp. SYSU BS000544]|uniref:response regulator transcription factor n=1 Tax=Brevibacillus sp. SYSU BS000544 TaxID=3416443 RepID=UPI003CE5B68D
MDQIRVLVIEDDQEWRNGLVDYVNKEADLTVAGTADTKAGALELFGQIEADVVLLDINLTENNLDGIEIALELTSIKPDYKIIMLTSLTADEVIVDSFSAGAVNYISKLNFREIPDAIRSAYHQQSAIHPTAAAALRNELLRLKQEEDQKLLSPSEKEILHLVHQGQTQSQIEKTLHITQRTIKNHINRILKKLGTKTSKEAAAKAKRKKLF